MTLLLLITASVKAQENAITGSWQLDIAQTVSLMDNGTKQKFDALDQGVKTRMETSMSGRAFTFSSNGTLSVDWQANGNPITSSGTWQTSGETLSITLNGELQQYTCEVTANSHLILRNTTPSGFFSNLYLTWHP